jgi:Fe-S-cluster containining protein
MKGYSLSKRLQLLETICRFYDEIAWPFHSWSCRPGCSACCTSMVILTTLEAAYLWEKYPVLLNERERSWVEDPSVPALRMTTNEHASLCLAKKECEEETAPAANPRPCPLLTNEQCSCYDARPLMCRLMFSSVSCDESGQAEIPPRLLSLNTVCLQLVEDLDRAGWSGYLTHVLPHFRNVGFVEAFKAGTAEVDDVRLRRNRPNPGLLVPPDDQEQVRQWLDDLRARLRGCG